MIFCTMSSIVYYSIFLILSCHRSVAVFSGEECVELGFVREQLMCSTCEKLNNYGLEILSENCMECCTQDRLSNTQRRYPLAVLEVCTCKFRAYPQIQAFIKSTRPAKFPNLIIKYVRGLDPTVKLLDAKGTVKEILSITKWNTDTVEEFFETHLEKDVSAVVAKAILESSDIENDDYLGTNIV